MSPKNDKGMDGMAKTKKMTKGVRLPASTKVHKRAADDLEESDNATPAPKRTTKTTIRHDPTVLENEAVLLAATEARVGRAFMPSRTRSGAAHLADSKPKVPAATMNKVTSKTVNNTSKTPSAYENSKLAIPSLAATSKTTSKISSKSNGNAQVLEEEDEFELPASVAKSVSKKTVRPQGRFNINDLDIQPEVTAQVSKNVKAGKSNAISKSAISGSDSLQPLANTRTHRNTRAVLDDETDPDAETDTDAMASDEDDSTFEVTNKTGTKVNKVVPRLIDGVVIGSALTPEEFLEKQKRGHWGNGRIGKNKSPSRRKRRVGATPKTVEQMNKGDWIIVNMHLETKTWKEVDTAWNAWNKKPSTAKDYSVVRNRYEQLEKMLCKELNFDVNTNFLLQALEAFRNEKKTLDDELEAFKAQHAEKVRKLQDAKWDRVPAIMKDLGAEKEFTSTAVSVRFHYLTNRKCMTDNGEWLTDPLDLTTPGASTVVRTRQPKKRYVPGSEAAKTETAESEAPDVSVNQVDTADRGEQDDDEDQESLEGDNGEDEFEEEEDE